MLFHEQCDTKSDTTKIRKLWFPCTWLEFFQLCHLKAMTVSKRNEPQVFVLTTYISISLSTSTCNPFRFTLKNKQTRSFTSGNLPKYKKFLVAYKSMPTCPKSLRPLKDTELNFVLKKANIDTDFQKAWNKLHIQSQFEKFNKAPWGWCSRWSHFSKPFQQISKS